MTNREAREHSELEGQIAALEAEIAAMEAELSNPETFLKLGAGTNDYIASLERSQQLIEIGYQKIGVTPDVMLARSAGLELGESGGVRCDEGLRTSAPGQRPPASVLGALLDRDGPGSLGTHLARLGEAASNLLAPLL